MHVINLMVQCSKYDFLMGHLKSGHLPIYFVRNTKNLNDACDYSVSVKRMFYSIILRTQMINIKRVKASYYLAFLQD